MANMNLNQGKNGKDLDFSATNKTQDVDMQMMFEMIRNQRQDIDDSKRREQELTELLKEIRGSNVNKEIGVTITPNEKISGSCPLSFNNSRVAEEAVVNKVQNYVPEVTSQPQSVPNTSQPQSVPNTSVIDWKEIALTLMTFKCSLINLTEKPTFNGSRKENPVRFLNKFEIFWKDMEPFTKNKLRVVINCLIDNAAEWAMLFRKDWANFDDFKKDFLNFYWPETKQRYMMNKWLSLSFQDKGKLNMSEYFIRLFNDLRTVTIIQSEAAILDHVMRQFPDHVRSLWGIMAEKTINSALKLLKTEHYNQEENRSAKRMRYSPESRRGRSDRKESRKLPLEANTVMVRINRPLAIMDNEQEEEREETDWLEYVSGAN